MSGATPAPDAWIPVLQENMNQGDILREILHELRELNSRSRLAAEKEIDPSGDPIQNQTFTTFSAALLAYTNRPGRSNEIAAMSTIAIFVAGLGAALLAYGSQVFSTRGGYKVTDTLVTAGFAFGTFVCLKVAVLNMSPVGQGTVGSNPEAMDEQRLLYFKTRGEKFHGQQIPKVNIEEGRRKKGISTSNRPLGLSASFRLSRTFTDEDEQEHNERLMAACPPLDAAEMRFVRKMDRGFGTRMGQASVLLQLGGAAVLVSLLILAWAEMGKATAILLTCTHFLFSASYTQAYFRQRGSRKKIMKRYQTEEKQSNE
ncbi:SubName: Full=Uncharacterized protein {ECO:0000313/EMBL:CCA67525.1} [Serendipita indica DSM 11827]|nr:SubName: Full=Uncharacterized protein {ECO:0000313/EMBL:CCA67525.1} [Serendipita indica DSM 11827]